jgi:flagellar biosynthesis protein FliP
MPRWSPGLVPERSKGAAFFMTNAGIRPAGWLIRSLLLLLAILAHGVVAAQTAQVPGQLPLLVGTGPGGNSYSVPIQTLLFFTALSFLPAVLLMMTGFTRIVIVLSLLRQALGTQASPPNQVIVGLSLFLTVFIMGPTLDRVYEDAYLPYSKNTMAFEQALDKAEVPMRAFMARQTRQSDLSLFVRLAKLDPGATAQTVPMRVLVPAFVTSELKSAFQIGFMIFIPFLVIDIVVASVLMSLGMMMLSPVLVALPFKLMLFVLADGWNLLIGSLAASFAP